MFECNFVKNINGIKIKIWYKNLKFMLHGQKIDKYDTTFFL